MKKIVFSTGAGISAESGLSTFRDADGLWENYPVMQVASAEGFAADPALVHQFYNMRRAQLVQAEPNVAHRAVAELEKHYHVQVITQNVDDLHERAGSSNVLHLHGELMKVRTMDYIAPKVYTLPSAELSNDMALETSPETVDARGRHVRPHIVFFGEDVPNFGYATEVAAQADVFVVVGTSLAVYPAASLLQYVRPGTPIFYIDPKPAAVPEHVTVIAETASVGMQQLIKLLERL